FAFVKRLISATDSIRYFLKVSHCFRSLVAVDERNQPLSINLFYRLPQLVKHLLVGAIRVLEGVGQDRQRGIILLLAHRLTQRHDGGCSPLLHGYAPFATSSPNAGCVHTCRRDVTVFG